MNSVNETADPKYLGKQLLLFSILALFCELLVIRWLSTEIRIFAYFKNLPLTAAFLGMGLGFVWAGNKRSLMTLSTGCFLFLSLLLSVALGLGLTFLTFVDPLSFLLFGFGSETVKEHTLTSTFGTVAIMLATFVLTATSFVGMGQEMGRLFEKLEPLKAYSINVLGGLIGTLLFSALSFCYASPGVWLMVAGALFCWLRPRPLSLCILLFGVCYQFWLGSYICEQAWGKDHLRTIWSPYYRIDLRGHRLDAGSMKGALVGTELYANYDGFQSIIDLSDKTLAAYPPEFRSSCIAYHSEPFQFVANKPDSKVLVLGAGAGMDVAAALRNNINHVDAVEIDPGIAMLGKEFERPYLSPKVTVHITDARTFLKNSHEKYDAIVFAYLDSHAAFSCLSSLRMDNYVFTQEALNDAAKLLKPDGYIAIGCVLMTDWLWDRHAKALQNATGMRPLGTRPKLAAYLNNGILFSGPRMLTVNAPSLKPVEPKADVPVATDDWPFLFLAKKEFPTVYVWPILMIVCVALLPVSTQFATGARIPFNWQMFFMGAGFMLLEVRSMADMSLMFGSTWLTNSVIIGGVMLMILLANMLAYRLRQSQIPLLAGGLFLSLLLTALIPASKLTFLGPLGGMCIGTGLCLLPMAFAALLFALFFRDAKAPSQALAFNLVGGVLGVFLEYSSMAWGVTSLSFIAMAIYAIPIILALKAQSALPVCNGSETP